MNCRTENCPNPVSDLDELCPECRKLRIRDAECLFVQKAIEQQFRDFPFVMSLGPWGEVGDDGVHSWDGVEGVVARPMQEIAEPSTCSKPVASCDFATGLGVAVCGVPLVDGKCPCCDRVEAL